MDENLDPNNFGPGQFLMPLGLELGDLKHRAMSSGFKYPHKNFATEVSQSLFEKCRNINKGYLACLEALNKFGQKKLTQKLGKKGLQQILTEIRSNINDEFQLIFNHKKTGCLWGNETNF